MIAFCNAALFVTKVIPVFSAGAIYSRGLCNRSLRADCASVHFLGDVGNVASRLEGLTKELDCTLVVSAATLAMSGFDRPQWRRTDVSIRGHDEGTLTVFPIQRLDDIVFAS